MIAPLLLTARIVIINRLYVWSPWFDHVQSSSLRSNDLLSSLYKIIVYALPVYLFLSYQTAYQQWFCNRSWTKQRRVYALWLANATMIVVSKYFFPHWVGAEELLFGYVYVFLVNSIVEEIVFRWWIQERLITRYGPIRGIVSQAILFTIVHIPLYWYVGSPLWLLGVLIGWVVFGSMAHHNKSLIPAIILHSIHNGLRLFLVI